MDVADIYNRLGYHTGWTVRQSDESIGREEWRQGLTKNISLGLKNMLHYQDLYRLIRKSDSLTLTFTSDFSNSYSSENTIWPLNTQLNLRKKDKISHVASKKMGYDSWLEKGTSLVPCGTSERFVHGLIAPLSERQYHWTDDTTL